MFIRREQLIQPKVGLNLAGLKSNKAADVQGEAARGGGGLR